MRGLALFVGALVLSTRVAGAAEIEGVRFPDHVENRGVAFAVHNVALFRWKVVFRAYVAALYRADAAKSFVLTGDTPKRLVINYFYAFTPEQFGQATIDGIAQNRTPAQLAALRPKIDEFNRLYRAVQPNDQYALTYVPGKGTELALNDKPLGVVEGAEFAAAMFDIWLGPNPINVTFRDAILSSPIRAAGALP